MTLKKYIYTYTFIFIYMKIYIKYINIYIYIYIYVYIFFHSHLYIEPDRTSKNHISLIFCLISKFYTSKKSFFQAEFDEIGFGTV